MKITNKTNLPNPIYQAMLNDPYTPGENTDISCTQLIDPPQKIAIARAHRDEISEDCADRLFALMGSAMHSILEQAETHGLVEERLYADVLGWKIAGQFDLLEDGVLSDYKFSSVWEWIYGLKQDRINQLNVLAWLCRQNGYEVDSLQIVFLFRDWAKSKAKYDQGYPQHQIAVVPVKLWDDDRAREYVEMRVRMHQQAREGIYEPCTEEERWAKPTKYAVMNKLAKRALRLLDTPVEAEEWMQLSGKGTHVEVRHGENTRCEYYCAAADYCEQFKGLK